MTVALMIGPYQDEDKVVTEQRFRQTYEALVMLEDSRNDLMVFTTMAHQFAIDRFTKRKAIPSIYKLAELAILSACDWLIVMALPGWRGNPSIRETIEWAAKKGKPIFLAEIDPEIESVRLRPFDPAEIGVGLDDEEKDK